MVPIAPSTLAGQSAKIRFIRLRASAKEKVLIWLAEEAAFGHFVLFVPVFLGVGVIVWYVLPREPADGSIYGLVLLTGLLAAFTLRSGALCRTLFSLAFLVSAGMMLAMVETRRMDTVILDSPVTTLIVGEVINREVDHKGRWRYIVSIKSTEKPVLRRPPKIASLLAIRKHEPIAVGAMLTGNARLSPPSGPALSGLNDFAFDAYFSGTGAVGYFFGSPKPAKTSAGFEHETGPGRYLNIWIESMRDGIGSRIRTILPGDTGAFATAIFTDQRRAISPATTDALRKAGLAHIIAISGLNMALAAGIFFVGMRSCLSLFMGLAHKVAIKKIAATGALCAISAYFLISGFAISAERAYVMMSIMLVSVLFDRRSISLRNVALSAMIVLIMSPSAIMGPSFQMSFAATVALVTGYSLYQRSSEDSNRINTKRYNDYLMLAIKFGSGIFMTSFIGGISTAIFALEHFNRIAGYGLPANLAAAPVISFIVMPAALASMLLMPFGLDEPALLMMGFGLDMVITIANTTAHWGGDVVTGRMPVWFLPITSAGFILLTMLRTRLRFSGLAVMLAASAAWFLTGAAIRPDILISEDGKLVGLVNETKIVSNKSKPPAFIMDQWKRALVLDAAIRPEIIRTDRPKEKYRWKLSTAEAALAEKQIAAVLIRLREDQFTCMDKVWCIGKTRQGFTVFLSENPAYVSTACRHADLVVTPAKWKDGRCREGPRIISRDMLRKSGALEITVTRNSGVFQTKTVAAMDARNRAWTRHRAYDWKTGIFVFAEVTTAETGGQATEIDLSDPASYQ